jgi:dsDNA-binding SOS-regulon protein
MQKEDLVQQLMMEEDRSAMSIFMAYSRDRFEAAFNMSVWLKSGFIPKHIKEYCREELCKLRNVRKIRTLHHHVPPP